MSKTHERFESFILERALKIAAAVGQPLDTRTMRKNLEKGRSHGYSDNQSIAQSWIIWQAAIASISN